MLLVLVVFSCLLFGQRLVLVLVFSQLKARSRGCMRDLAVHCCAVGIARLRAPSPVVWATTYTSVVIDKSVGIVHLINKAVGLRFKFAAVREFKKFFLLNY